MKFYNLAVVSFLSMTLFVSLQGYIIPKAKKPEVARAEAIEVVAKLDEQINKTKSSIIEMQKHLDVVRTHNPQSAKNLEEALEASKKILASHEEKRRHYSTVVAKYR